ncbi:3-deoxy-D-manno-octulosonic acid transferase [Parvularcula marina]|uniref:3-deoxy-D-manno-octulosonic acid transferase n=1 Tax=Parvularcula marina TaxID=2292771 RepID=UPI0035134616
MTLPRPIPVPRKAWSLKFYRRGSALLQPIADRILKQRLKLGKEDRLRVDERRGVAGRERPEGHLIWIHGASVGESLSILPLIDKLSHLYTDSSFLVTTGTVTSAALMAERLPEQAVHQYAPVDQPVYVRRFLDHWRPDVGFFVESEFWPVLIGETNARGIPLALVNGRLSPRSFKGWSRRKTAAHELLSAFSVILAQDEGNAERIEALARKTVHVPGNLKRAAAPLPTDQRALAELRAAVGARPVWLAASTHPGEEELILDAHEQMMETAPGLLTVIAPRHPARGDELEELITSRGLKMSRRSKGDNPGADDNVYLADTLGELGLFYRLSDVAFIGGSLVETGGHNPMEPARLGSAIVTGPHVFNFQETFNSMRQDGALALVRNERDLSASIIRLLSDPLTRQEMARKARAWSDAGSEKVLNDTIEALAPLLPPAKVPA